MNLIEQIFTAFLGSCRLLQHQRVQSLSVRNERFCSGRKVELRKAPLKSEAWSLWGLPESPSCLYIYIYRFLWLDVPPSVPVYDTDIQNSFCTSILPVLFFRKIHSVFCIVFRLIIQLGWEEQCSKETWGQCDDLFATRRPSETPTEWLLLVFVVFVALCT